MEHLLQFPCIWVFWFGGEKDKKVLIVWIYETSQSLMMENSSYSVTQFIEHKHRHIQRWKLRAGFKEKER